MGSALPPSDELDPIWDLHPGPGPFLATAIHDGHALRPEVAARMSLPDADRLREEDPLTARWTEVAPLRVVGTRSRFEVDLNRPRDQAIYRRPEDCWGLSLWSSPPDPAVFARSLEQYDAFYAAMHSLCDELVARHGAFVVFDLHSYNHRRGGPAAPPDDPQANPQVNVGTESIPEPFRRVADTFVRTLRAQPFPTGPLDVRENVKFRGGHWVRWIHEHFPGRGVALAIEIKKFYIDEWTGVPDATLVAAVGDALRATVSPVLEALQECRQKL